MPTDSDETGIDAERAWKLLIGGEWVDPAAGTYPVIDPNDGTVVGQAPEAIRGPGRRRGPGGPRRLTGMAGPESR